MTFTLETEHARVTAEKIGRGLKMIQDRLNVLNAALEALQVTQNYRLSFSAERARCARQVVEAEAELEVVARSVARTW